MTLTARAVLPVVTLGLLLSPSILHAQGICSPANTFYAAPNGTGNCSSVGDACSLSTAQQTVRMATQNGTTMNADICVKLEGSTANPYGLPSTFALTAADSGVTTASGQQYVIHWQADTGATPVLSGGKSIPGSRFTSDDGIIYHADISDLVGSNTNAVRQLYVNDQRLQRAQQAGSFFGFSVSSQGYHTTYTNMSTWQNPTDIEFAVHPDSISAPWVWSWVRPQSISGTGDITIMTPAWNLMMAWLCPTCGIEPAYVENAYELLSLPGDHTGQWYYNRSTEVLYYKRRPGDVLKAMTFVLSFQQTLMTGTGSQGNPLKNVSFEGVTFAYATWLRPSIDSINYVDLQQGVFITGLNANGTFQTETIPTNITFQYINNVHFSNCTFEHLGGMGVGLLTGSKLSSFDHSTFKDISSNGLYWTGPSGNDVKTVNVLDINEGNSLTFSTLTNVGAEYRGGYGIWAEHTRNTTITHNHAHHLPWGAININALDQNHMPTINQNISVNYNHIHHTHQVVGDGGSIYISAPEPGSIVSGNYLHDLGGQGAFLYLEDGAEGINWTGNVVWGVDSTLNPDPDPPVCNPTPKQPPISLWLYLNGVVYRPQNNTVSGNWFDGSPGSPKWTWNLPDKDCSQPPQNAPCDWVSQQCINPANKLVDANNIAVPCSPNCADINSWSAYPGAQQVIKCAGDTPDPSCPY